MTNSKRILLVLLGGLLILMSMMSFSWRSSTTYWYVNGQPYEWNFQQDVYAFRLQDASEFDVSQVNTQHIDHHEYRGDRNDKLNLIYFSEQSVISERDAIIRQIEGDIDFEAAFDVITLFPHLAYASGMWFVIDDQVLVNFRNQLTEIQKEDWALAHDLTQLNDLSNMPPGGNYTYIYQLDDNTVELEGGINFARRIYEADSNALLNAQPNLINAYEGTGGLVSTKDAEERNIRYYITNGDNNSLNVFLQLPEQAQGYTVNIYDHIGRQWVQEAVQASDNNLRIDISGLASGLYITNLRDQTGKKVATQKFQVF